MQTYLRFKQGYSFTITKKGLEKRVGKSFALPTHLIIYTEYAANESNINSSELVTRILTDYFNRNDVKILEKRVDCGIPEVINKTDEYIELYESRGNV